VRWSWRIRTTTTSRYIAGHTVERAESAGRAEELIRETIERADIVGPITVPGVTEENASCASWESRLATSIAFAAQRSTVTAR
jgi:hypothetical protein